MDRAYAYFDERLPAHRREVFAAELAEAGVTPNQLIWACRQLRLTPPPKGHRLHAPMPGEILAVLQPQISLDDEAEEIGAAIWGALARFGYSNRAAARAHLGERAWAVVTSRGGWQGLCESAYEADVTQWTAQLRRQAAAVLAREKVGQTQAQIQAARDKDLELEAAGGNAPDGSGTMSIAQVLAQLPEANRALHYARAPEPQPVSSGA